ncbi:hypothetical protein QYE76_026159 [Lolium multiflorum]|uniref:Uncharacterized protein n=1 Tax=Lolium multiflorum TaxID=4521 RepID=A0AAD8VUV9_LOLMU|nr:hypothetical protein QYE76_026159 [Lolium multiflorum]
MSVLRRIPEFYPLRHTSSGAIWAIRSTSGAIWFIPSASVSIPPAASTCRLGTSGEYSSSKATGDTEEEHPTGRDRAKAAARKGRRKGKEASSSSEVGSKSFVMRNMMKGLVKAKLFKQWNKMKDRSNMDEAEKRKHAKAIKMVEKELGLEEDDDEEEEQEEEEEE